MMQYDVYCPFCAVAYFKTNDNFDPARLANGAMIDMKEPWAGYGWTGPPKDESVQFGNLYCPSCGPGAVITDLQGRFAHLKEVAEPAEQVAVPGVEPAECRICGAKFKSHHALGGHMKSHSKNNERDTNV